ncbi:MAG: glycosyltransferase family 2 protein [Desulfuromonadaceae bacterium]
MVIASHGRLTLLVQLLESLFNASRSNGSDIEVLVVDSTPDGAGEAIQDACSRTGAVFIEGAESVRRKRNLGAETATGKWLLFVDSDCTAAPDLFAQYLSAFRANPARLVAAGPTVFQGGETAFTRRIGDSSLLGPFRRPGAPGDLPWATTSNLCLQRDLFLSVGGFREDFPFRLGGDDTDLCLRLRSGGHRVLSVPEAVCFHSWNTWSHPLSVFRRSFRWGWMHAILLREHPHYCRLDSPGLPVHALACLAVALICAVFGSVKALLAPLFFVGLAVALHAMLVAAGAPRHAKATAFWEDLVLAFVELPFGFGRVVGSLVGGTLLGAVYRLDVSDQEMDGRFPETVRSLWSDHLALLLTVFFIGYVL